MRFHALASPPDIYTDGPGKVTDVVVWKDGRHFPTKMRWGLQPSRPEERTISLLRAEGRAFARRCLIVASKLYLRPGTGPGGSRRTVEMLDSGGSFFCFAGTWLPESPSWPAAFAGITVEAYPDIEPYQDRHMAVVPKRDWRAWLSGEASETEILRPLPVGSFRVSGPPKRAAPPQARAAATGDLFG
jgi:putative SOS response-associated peptidase YedK